MGNVEIPQWLKGLPLAPEFRPTDTEFADPIAYISKIEKEASAFGICKVIPPLPKPSKKYVFSNLNKSLLKTRELGVDGNLTEVGDSSKKLSEDKRNEGESRAVFTTRQQELGQDAKRSRASGEAPNPGSQKQVWQSGEFYTLEQFESKSKVFSRSVLSSVKEVTPLVIEALFWKAAKEKPIYVEYANDVPGSGFQEPEGLLRYFCARKRRRFCAQGHGGNSYFYQGRVSGHDATNLGNEVEVAASSSASPFVELGKGFMDPQTASIDEFLQSNRQRGVCTNPELEGTAGWKLSNCPWNLQVIARSAGSLTRYMLDDIPGVTSPMIYIGMLFSWFAWHVEDHELHSLNFLHTGSPKTWYAVPGDYAFAFEDCVRKQAYGGDVEHFAALKILGEKTTLLSPEIVVASGIPCCRLVQNPGEFVVTFPRAYHIGFSHGFNCGEAANFGTPQWLTIAKEAAVRRAVMDHLPMLSHQQLLYLLTMSFISRIPRSLLPGVRSSRLKNRMKEERELLVKKAFIEDILKENQLLYTLLGKDSAFRAVLWHPDSLPSFDRDSTSPAGTVLAAELSILSNDGLNQERQVSCEKSLNNLYLESDLLCDFQVDSGTLVCVACGILGYPIMSVVQPSKQESIVNFPAESISVTGAVDLSQQLDLETNNDGKWDTSVFLRPRIFCLEHALHVEELLRSKGGAKILVICHSDFKKIKANATAIAEELRSSFNYKEVQLDTASLEELKLIDLAIDSEQLTDFQEDWTAKLGMNLRFSVKTRKAHLPKKIELALNVDHLLSIMAPVSRISRIKWCSRKSRTKREPNHRTIGKSFNGNVCKKDESSHLSNSMEVKPKTLLQYCRRKLRAKSRNSAPEQVASAMVLTTEVWMSTSSDFNLLRTPLVGRESDKANECIDAESCFSKENKAIDMRGEIELAVDLLNDELGGADVGVRHEECAFPSFKVPENLVESGTCKPDSFSTCTELTITMGADDMHVHSIDELHDSSQAGVRAPSMTLKQEEKGKKLGTAAKGVRGDRSKQKRKLEQQCEAPNDFVRSPCEGLRPRKNKVGSVYSVESELPEEKSVLKKLKKSSGNIVSCNQVLNNVTSYQCNIEGCRMHFRTRAQLSSHKNNKCHHKDCGKRFQSHKYVVLHQRVHEDERPLKCMWKGCTMTFKWAWARTEHLRLHTGERPYKCKIKGCGLTFRFVSDFSRHRRKTGHHANPPPK